MLSVGDGGGRAVGVRLRAWARGVHHQQAARLRHEASALAQDQDAQGPQVPDQQEGPTGRGTARRKCYITYILELHPDVVPRLLPPSPHIRFLKSSSTFCAVFF